MGATLEILRSGPLSTIQDLGRPGYAATGVGESGAADRGSLRLANRLVGNDENAAAIEATLGGLELRAESAVTVAVTGAPCELTAGGCGQAMNTLISLAAGATLRLGAARRGLRSYVAVRGGIDVEPVLGSRSTDLLSGLGPAPLAPGVRLPVGPEPAIRPMEGRPSQRFDTDDLVLRVVPGPRDSWFARSALTRLFTESYVVTSETNRIGVRLDGPALTRVRHGDLPSEGLVAGGLLVPPSGKPTLSLVNHPVLGDFPAIATVLSADLDKAAQARPGQHLRFVALDALAAQAARAA